MIETEITSEINKKSFEKYVNELTSKLGEPKKVKRAAFMITERGKGLDNRVKITNGNVELVQKFKISIDANGKRIKEEVTISLDNNKESILEAIKLCENFYRANEVKPLRLIVQHENFLWIYKDTEIKLAHQFGKNDYFVYEIEALKDNANIEEIEKELNFKPDADLNSEERKLYRIEQVDLNMDEMELNAIVELIDKYLGYK
jgi:hypothetical protein